MEEFLVLWDRCKASQDRQKRLGTEPLFLWSIECSSPQVCWWCVLHKELSDSRDKLTQKLSGSKSRTLSICDCDSWISGGIREEIPKLPGCAKPTETPQRSASLPLSTSDLKCTLLFCKVQLKLIWWIIKDVLRFWRHFLGKYQTFRVASRLVHYWRLQLHAAFCDQFYPSSGCISWVSNEFFKLLLPWGHPGLNIGFQVLWVTVHVTSDTFENWIWYPFSSIDILHTDQLLQLYP